MKYMILTYASQHDYDGMAGEASDGQAWSPEDFAAMASFMETRALAAPVHTRRLGAQRGVSFVTDGPYAETQEVLAGYWIVECDSFDRATEIAGRLAGCPAPEQVVANAYADVRPIMESAAEMSY